MSSRLERYPRLSAADRPPLTAPRAYRQHGKQAGLAAVLVLLALGPALAPTSVAQAAGGTDSTCTQASIQSDVNSGGTWTLACAGSPTTVPFTVPVTVTSGMATVQVASG